MFIKIKIVYNEKCLLPDSYVLWLSAPTCRPK